MALLPATLESAFALLPESGDGTAAAADFAGIYATYATEAQAGVILPLFTGTEETRFAAALAAAFTNTNGTPASAAAAFVLAVTEFWLTPPVPFGVPPVTPLAVVTAFIGAPVLQTQLEALLGVPNDLPTFAAGLAAALDTATRTITVQLAAFPFTIFNLS